MPLLRWPARPRGPHLPTRQRVPALTTSGSVVDPLVDADLEVLGRITPASNLALLVTVGDGHAIYKPVAGERPLWDFPDGTLAAREVAAHLVSVAGGFDIVPRTVLRDGPHGPGSVQQWVGDPAVGLTPVVDIVPGTTAPSGWLPAFAGEDGTGAPVLVVHEDAPDLRTMAVLDVVLNNSDRKGAHVARDAGGHLWGFDHGVTCHAEPKLRTVLWGWVGRPLDPADLARLARLDSALEDPDDPAGLRSALSGLLTRAEVSALRARVDTLRHTGVHPGPSPDWPSIPWPPL